MTAVAPHGVVGNPFSTRHVRPGRVPALDAAGREIDLSELLARFAKINRSAAIVGPHGSGKTTLLGQLADVLEADGSVVARVRIGRIDDTLTLLAAVVRVRRGGVVCVDSWERLGPIRAHVIRWCACAARTRLLVTAHGKSALPTLWECRPTPTVLRALVGRLPSGGAGMPPILEADMQQAFHDASGDIREALFLLYDTFEARARTVREATA